MKISILHPSLFELGHVVSTQGVMGASTHELRLQCLLRHSQGDWGCVCPEDAETNNEAVASGLRILSAYAIDETKPCKGFGSNTLWIITEADRSATTLLLPEEY